MGRKLVIPLNFEKYQGVRDYKELKDYQENQKDVDEIEKVLLGEIQFKRYTCYLGSCRFIILQKQRRS